MHAGAEEQDKLSVTLDDLQEHTVRYGLDVFPPLDARNELRRAQELFAVLQERWPRFYQALSLNPTANEFAILTTHKVGDAASARVRTLEFTQRGPVFSYPLLLPPPFGHCDQEASIEEVFKESLGEIHSLFPGLKVLRVGLIRELVFGTGQVNPVSWLMSNYPALRGTELKAANAALTFRDERCNIRVQITCLRITRQTQHPVSRHAIQTEEEFGLGVNFDVNNIDMKPQTWSDIELVLERAKSLWPRELLDFLNRRVVE